MSTEGAALPLCAGPSGFNFQKVCGFRRLAGVPRAGARIEIGIGMTSKASLRKTISPLMLIFLWEIGVQTKIINPLFLPAPSAIAKAGWQLLISGDLVRHAGTSLWRAFCGLSIGAPMAIISGVFIGLKRSGEDFLEPPLELLRSIPPVSMISVALLWFGIGAKLSIFIIAWATELA